MPRLRARIEASPETISDFEFAAELRFWDALELLFAGRPHAYVYLSGFVAEILLKLACFKLDSASPADPVDAKFGPATKYMKKYCPHAHRNRESYHSLLYWLRMLQHLRRTKNKPFDPQFESQLVHCVRRLYLIWSIDLRYHSESPTANEIKLVYDDVAWLRNHSAKLWR